MAGARVEEAAGEGGEGRMIPFWRWLSARFGPAVWGSGMARLCEPREPELKPPSPRIYWEPWHLSAPA